MRYFLITALFASTASFAAFAQSPTEAVIETVAEKPFVKKRYTIDGTARIEQVEGETHLVFSETFRTKNGPDLKLYLSKHSMSDLSAKDVDANAVRLSVLKSNRGEQRYTIPSDIDISDYRSVVIQCEAYTVLWGGFDL